MSETLALTIRQASVADAPHLSRYYVDNARHLEPWEPAREPGFHEAQAWRCRLEHFEAAQRAGTAAHFLAYADDAPGLLATCSLTNIVRGPFMACYMGYSVAAAYEGRGVMRALCRHVIAYAFDELGLNRIMANHMPRNLRSARLLQSLGFEREGLARDYLRINGRWEDHVLTALVNSAGR